MLAEPGLIPARRARVALDSRTVEILLYGRLAWREAVNEWEPPVSTSIVARGVSGGKTVSRVERFAIARAVATIGLDALDEAVETIPDPLTRRAIHLRYDEARSIGRVARQLGHGIGWTYARLEEGRQWVACHLRKLPGRTLLDFLWTVSTLLPRLEMRSEDVTPDPVVAGTTRPCSPGNRASRARRGYLTRPEHWPNIQSRVTTVSANRAALLGGLRAYGRPDVSKENLTIHPDWLAQVERDGRLTVSARVTFTAKTGLTHLAAAGNLEKVRELLLVEADVAVRRLTRARDPRSLDGLKQEERANP